MLSQLFPVFHSCDDRTNNMSKINAERVTGFLISTSLLILLVFGGTAVHGQSGQDYSIRWNTETSFDQVPFGNLVAYVFMSVAFAKEHEVLSSSELSIIYDAEMANPKLERTYRLFEEACTWYLQAKQDGNELDYRYMGNIFSLADEYEAEDRKAPYLEAYEKLSPESKQYVLDRIESIRGTRVMSSSTTDYRRMFVDHPDVAVRAYERLCSRLPEMLERLENWPEQKTIEAQEIRL